MKKYPTYLSIGNWLFIHIEANKFETNPVGGEIPNNLYMVNDLCFDLSKNLRTYESLIKYGCTEPDKKEIIRLLNLQ